MELDQAQGDGSEARTGALTSSRLAVPFFDFYRAVLSQGAGAEVQLYIAALRLVGCVYGRRDGVAAVIRRLQLAGTAAVRAGRRVGRCPARRSTATDEGINRDVQ